jgi:carboxylesterase family protein
MSVVAWSFIAVGSKALLYFAPSPLHSYGHPIRSRADNRNGADRVPLGARALLSSFVKDAPQDAQGKCGKSGYHNCLNREAGMKGRKRAARFAALAGTLATLCASSALANDQVKTECGVVEGVAAASPGVRIFRGVPFAAPPVGAMRWKAPQPVKPWKGVRKAAEFGPRSMQAPVYPDMIFRDRADKPMSEDCLYLNVWTAAKSAKEGLSVMAWFYGGGFQAGSSRLGIFGFLSYPELTKESREHASGNYGLMDQIAGLRRVKKNIAAFGGNPNKVTSRANRRARSQLAH